ncbi:unnamed protein product [Cryptosporidium hominis]|uniref:Uncharacterized protein with CCHC-type Zinc finger n=2 Tax=Cryptosporidium hominis TaxID=237895 RepID=A0A0S4TGE5_CRYHO|nr:Uncharacterized protein with CCHC-type Zinc finger [Cryptosporidium hominis]CUV06203.1 unnamed protein product [Cryptosporidium hominis]|eukprot:PPS94290.1 Uncharacterized protein with CCHC-type Zinc finger [Cryptosporidium hominis]
MTQVEELFTIDLEGEEVKHDLDQAEDNRFEYEFDKIGSEIEKCTQKTSDDDAKTSIYRSEIKSDGEINDDEDYEDNQSIKYQHQNDFQGDSDDRDFDISKFELSNCKSIEKIKNLQDSELESIVSLELWNLYKEMGPNIWPSFLRYENPPKHVKMLESRFYLNKSGKSDQEVVFANVKDVYSPSNDEDASEKNCLSHINEVLKGLSENKGFYSRTFDSEQNARDGLINLYLITNGIKKSTSSGRCQFCGSSKCDRKAKNCKANRCFKCLLKGHQIKDCDTKYGYFNQQLLLPTRMERENIFTERNLIENLFSFSKRKKFDIQINNSKLCICLNCNQTGHVNCGRQAPMFSKGSKIKDMISSTESKFLIFPEDSNSISQINRNQYLKTNIIIPSNKLFNISYLLEFTKSSLNQTNIKDKVVEIEQESRPIFTSRNNNFSQINNRPYPQNQIQFHHPNQFNIHNHNVLQQQIPNQAYSYHNHNLQYQHFQNNLQLHAHLFQQDPIYRNPNQLLQGQQYNYDRLVSNQINAGFASNQNNTVYSRSAVQTNRTTTTSNAKRKVFNCGSNFRGRRK